MLSFYGLIQDDCYIFRLKPVGYTKSYQRMGAPTLLNEQVVQDNVLGSCAYFFRVLSVKNAEVKLRWKSRRLLGKVLFLG
jgi:hypothetical protein